MKEFFKLDEKLLELDVKARELCRDTFNEIDKISMHNQHKVLSAFINNRA